MKNPRFSEYQVVLGLKKDNKVKQQVSELTGLVKVIHDSLLALRYHCEFKATMLVNTIDDCNRTCTLEKEIKFSSEETLIPEYGEFEPDYFYKLLFRKIESIWNPQELRYWGRKVTSIVFENVYISIPSTKVIVWTEKEVGIYHIEQECGEGWIMLPRYPRNNTWAEFKEYTDFTEK